MLIQVVFCFFYASPNNLLTIYLWIMSNHKHVLKKIVKRLWTSHGWVKKKNEQFMIYMSHEQAISIEKVINKSWASYEHVETTKYRENHEQVMNKLWSNCEHVMDESWKNCEQFMNMSWMSHEKLINNLWTSCEKVWNKS